MEWRTSIEGSEGVVKVPEKSRGKKLDLVELNNEYISPHVQFPHLYMGFHKVDANI